MIKTLLLALALPLTLHSITVGTCTLDTLKIPATDLIIHFQQSLLSNLALDANYTVFLLKYEEPKSSKLYKAMFQVLNAKYQATYVGVLFSVKSEAPVLDTFVQSKHQRLVAELLGLGKYTESLVCPDFKAQMRQRFLKFVGYLSAEHKLHGECRPVSQLGAEHTTVDRRRLQTASSPFLSLSGAGASPFLTGSQSGQQTVVTTTSNGPGSFSTSVSSTANGKKEVSFSSSTVGNSAQSISVKGNTAPLVTTVSGTGAPVTTVTQQPLATLTTSETDKAGATTTKTYTATPAAEPEVVKTTTTTPVSATTPVSTTTTVIRAVISPVIEVKVKTVLKNIWGLVLPARGAEGNAVGKIIVAQQKRLLGSDEVESRVAFEKRRSIEIYKRFAEGANY